MSRLQSLKHDYETALSPLRRIPSKITMEILRRSWKYNEFGGIPRGRRLPGFNVFTIREGPWHLGQVCSSWRNVIETLCPELWATMTVEIPFSMFLKTDAVEILNVVLDRSRNYPLDFHFEYYGTRVERRAAQATERCFHIMVAHSKRWRAVEMTIPPGTCTSIVFAAHRPETSVPLRLPPNSKNCTSKVCTQKPASLSRPTILCLSPMKGHLLEIGRPPNILTSLNRLQSFIHFRITTTVLA
ncbi:uncharacterized protein EV420DRAFT_861776 [Desarmillaria tabescens]|uniref:F-box domain-containing protein n=1 Tax=Armillaria tabescens TaxID=1929756 RepID=A0AA39JRZ7_ARMTA|nr:uncharacterized protein EV420DRAFT_861776 [Desarmillaria tabescens]KAK0447835.1 hypothetical protein EV420DRAFT_861776 [Desarmillaria tabescens]